MKNRIGEEYFTKEGYWIEIIRVLDSRNYTIRFKSSSLVLENLQYAQIKSGRIKNPYHPSVQGVGYKGIGKYKAKINGIICAHYKTWYGMIQRSYSVNLKVKKVTYEKCKTTVNWHNYQNFAKWFDINYVEGFDLDKDILIKGNKIYSPETCEFVPPEINSLFILQGKSRGKYPIGVSKRGNKFCAYLAKEGNQTRVGSFNTSEEAFECYKLHKEAWIKELANKWRGKITERCYWAMLNYKVEITD